MTTPCKQMQANEIATWPALFMSASAASADTRLRRIVSPFSPSTYCTSMPQGFSFPSARLARPACLAFSACLAPQTELTLEFPYCYGEHMLLPNWRIGRALGIPIHVHASWFV